MSQRSRLIYAGRTAVQPADSMDVFGRLSFGTLRARKLEPFYEYRDVREKLRGATPASFEARALLHGEARDRLFDRIRFG